MEISQKTQCCVKLCRPNLRSKKKPRRLGNKNNRFYRFKGESTGLKIKWRTFQGLMENPDQKHFKELSFSK